jgi:hypothetical protein
LSISPAGLLHSARHVPLRLVARFPELAVEGESVAPSRLIIGVVIMVAVDVVAVRSMAVFVECRVSGMITVITVWMIHLRGSQPPSKENPGTGFRGESPDLDRDRGRGHLAGLPFGWLRSA